MFILNVFILSPILQKLKASTKLMTYYRFLHVYNLNKIISLLTYSNFCFLKHLSL